MQPSGIFETVLYADDLAAAERFYHDALGLEVIERGNLVAAFRCRGGVLLVFDPRTSAVPGRDVPSHGTSGAGHVAFAAKPENIDTLRPLNLLFDGDPSLTQLKPPGIDIFRLCSK